jgi:hypothetical protein
MTPRWIVPLVVVADVAVVTLLFLVLGWPAVFFAVPVVVGSVIALVVLTMVGKAKRAVSELRIPAGPYRVVEGHTWSTGTEAYPDWTGQTTWSSSDGTSSDSTWSDSSWSDSGSGSSDSGSSSSAGD